MVRSYIFAAVLMFVANLWTYGQPTIPGLTGSRILQGVSLRSLQ